MADETNAVVEHDLVIIGAGPGGYVAAIRAAQLGLNVACIEKEPALGGTCLRVGCIPSKAMLESSELFHQARTKFEEHGIDVGELNLNLKQMLSRKDEIVESLTSGVAGLFKKNKVTRYVGHGRVAPVENGKNVVFVDGESETKLHCKHVIIATGSVVAGLPGIEMDCDFVGGSTEALSFPEVPEHLVVIGAGVIGLELGSVWLRLGAKVTVLEYADRIIPGMDKRLGKRALSIFKKQGFDFKLGAKVTGARRESDHCVVEAEGLEPITCDRVLVSVGRKPYTESLGLETMGIALDKRGRVEVNDHFETSAPGVFAIGDVIKGPMLAHKAEEEGIACVEYIVTGYGHVNYDAIPSVVYTDPEIAWVGKNEEELKEAGIPFNSGSFMFGPNGRAKALGQTEGQVKILAHKETDRVLGVHMVGPRVGELIAEATMAMEFGASSEDIARTCHAHPTLTEVVKEAAMDVEGRAIHR
ncbi:MAG: dihydrolipoamide dehydrogenase [Myxococcota bacterium]